MKVATDDRYKTIAIIRLTALGDIVHTLPAFHLLRQRFPGARISWFAEPTGAKLLELVDGLDEIIPAPLKTNGFSNKYKEVRRLISQHKKRFDLVLDFQGLWKSAILARLLRGHSIGFGKQNLKEPQARFFYSRHAEPFDEAKHVIFKNLHLVSQLFPGKVNPEESLTVEYPLRPLPEDPDLTDFMTQNGLEENNYAIINTGGGWESKILSAEQHIEVIEAIKSKYRLVLLWGNEKEKKTAQHIAELTGVAVAPFLEFGALLLFIKRSRLVVTADTLALHAADMVETPSVGIFGPTSPQRNGSLLKESRVVHEKIDCGFCYKKKCGTITCIKNIKAKNIIEAIELTYEKHC
jgi:heptosyltransferase-1